LKLMRMASPFEKLNLPRALPPAARVVAVASEGVGARGRTAASQTNTGYVIKGRLEAQGPTAARADPARREPTAPRKPTIQRNYFSGLASEIPWCQIN
jgi:hypothetical protein